MKGFLTLVTLFALTFASHLDDDLGQLTNFKYDEVVMKTFKDCSLDQTPGVHFSFMYSSINSSRKST